MKIFPTYNDLPELRNCPYEQRLKVFRRADRELRAIDAGYKSTCQMYHLAIWSLLIILLLGMPAGFTEGALGVIYSLGSLPLTLLLLWLVSESDRFQFRKIGEYLRKTKAEPQLAVLEL